MAKKMKKKRKILKQIGFSPELLDAISNLADENQMDVSAMVRLLLVEALRNRNRDIERSDKNESL
jgi:hypothetical protein